jgi:hypothetical protein
MTNSDVNMTAKKGATCFGTTGGFTISWVDITCVVVTVVCELYTMRQLCGWFGRGGPRDDEWYFTFTRGADGNCTNCSKPEGNHIAQPDGDKRCIPRLDSSSTFTRGADGKCIICSNTEGNHIAEDNGNKYCSAVSRNRGTLPYLILCPYSIFRVSVHPHPH